MNGVDTECCRILVIDDNADGADTLAMVLRLMGHTVRTANDGMAGLEEAEDFRPEVIILDIDMPKLNGIEVCRRLRHRDWAESILIIALTGYTYSGDREDTKAAGFNYHFRKPVDFDTLQGLLSCKG